MNTEEHIKILKENTKQLLKVLETLDKLSNSKIVIDLKSVIDSSDIEPKDNEDMTPPVPPAPPTDTSTLAPFPPVLEKVETIPPISLEQLDIELNKELVRLNGDPTPINNVILQYGVISPGLIPVEKRNEFLATVRKLEVK